MKTDMFSMDFNLDYINPEEEEGLDKNEEGEGANQPYSTWRKVKQMQPMWLCFLSCMRSEETFEKAQWRKVKQMQPV